MKIVAIIPARMGSVRLPGKPLLDLRGKPLIEHTYQRASQVESISRVIVATDDARIFEAVRAFGGEAAMTSPEHPTGTDRIAEVALELDCDYVVNVQGDEALIDPRMIGQVIRATTARKDVAMGTAARAITDLGRFRDPMVVKVVVDAQGFALYFSRTPIPFLRDASEEELASPGVLRNFLEHVGLYVYRRDFLLQFIRMPQTPLEKMEKLEQLRALENGHKIAVARTEYFAFGIDTPEDLEEARGMSAVQ
ncbi:MAG: 3-deoxy-manno-octulosonate cytidylyltransferase [Candidatus Latescibacterota bacterium]